MTVTYQIGTDGKPLITKRQKSVRKYSVDWSLWLQNGETILSAIWTSSTGVTLTLPTNTTTSAAVTVSGGTIGTTEWISCTITTATSTEVQTLYLSITAR
jgi:hypothetical protein